jgi:hypothetical protein
MGLTGAQNERVHRNAGRDHLFIFGIENEIAGRGAAGFATLGWGGLSAGGAAAARAPAGPARKMAATIAGRSMQLIFQRVGVAGDPLAARALARELAAPSAALGGSGGTRPADSRLGVGQRRHGPGPARSPARRRHPRSPAATATGGRRGQGRRGRGRRPF